MKLIDKDNAAAKNKRAARGAGPLPARKVAKAWSIKLEQRLPQKIGQPLGSASGSE